MASTIYLGLVHYPIYNKRNEVIATAITNFDLHDISRTSRTYDIKRFFVIHPLESQTALARDILGYWREGGGGRYNPDRQEALSVLEVAPDIAAVIRRIEEAEGSSPIVVTTDARRYPNTVSYTGLRRRLEAGRQPCLLLFGTGWGMEKTLMAQFDYILEPIYGRGGYNHLPVRAAVAIILDRLLGSEWWLSRD